MNLDLQTYINNAMAVERSERLAASDRLTLGEMILKLEPIVEKQKDRKPDEEAHVRYDFEYLYPTKIDSWRGVYAELALNFEDSRSSRSELTVTEFLQLLKDAIGKTFTGYKGGDFTMSRQTPVWVANYGNAGSTAVIDIVDGGHQVIIITAFRES